MRTPGLRGLSQTLLRARLGADLGLFDESGDETGVCKE